MIPFLSLEFNFIHKNSLGLNKQCIFYIRIVVYTFVSEFFKTLLYSFIISTRFIKKSEF